MKSRTPFFLAAIAAFFVASSLFGFRLLTADVATPEALPTCENRSVAKGEDLTSNLVTVNVFNASKRSGLANRASINLQRRGFLAGDVANTTSKVETKTVSILTRDKSDPRVKLVAANFKDKITYADPDITAAAGVIVILGDDYSGLSKKEVLAVESDRPITMCVPIVTVEP